MRVVGGKTGADGRLFAYIVWTVPGGPAEKYGLQQGDKVSEIFFYTILLIYSVYRKECCQLSFFYSEITLMGAI